MKLALGLSPILLFVVAGCGSESPAHDLAQRDEVGMFTLADGASGLDFVHFNGMSGAYYFSEHVGPGVALFDYDNDGDLDLYAVQGGMLGNHPDSPSSHELRDRLFRNDLTIGADGSPQLRWTDVTKGSGLDARGYGMGVATGDIDNDGWIDLYVTNFGRNQLWRNRGDGTFEDISRQSGTDDPEWSVPAVFSDLDRDGWLDLFVANYVDFTLATHKLCRQVSGAPEYCGPLSYEPVADRLFRNRGGEGDTGRFDDLSANTGIRSASGGALGATVGDFNGDGWPDLYVANDGTPNLMWINQGSSAASGQVTFRERAFVAGSAVNALGQAEASMGVSAADFDRDGDEDLFMTHLTRETHTLYRNDGHGNFDDASKQVGIDMATWDATGFGTAWLDLDNDGWLDLLTVNGAVKTIPEQVAAGDPHPLRQPNQLFRNLGPDADGRIRLQEASELAGPAFDLVEVSRGAAIGDIDNDGDTDVVIANNAGPLRLLINRVGQDNSWVGLRLVGADTPRDMLGAWVGVALTNGDTLWRRVSTAGSYASASDPRLLFGLGDISDHSDSPIDRVTVHWPNGDVETWAGEIIHIERYNTLQQGGSKG